MSEIAILQVETDALRTTIQQAVLEFLERHPDLRIGIDGEARVEPLDGREPEPPGAEILGVTRLGPIILTLTVDVVIRGR